MLDLAGTKDTRRIDNKCQRVAIESTGVFWIPTYTLLEDKVETIIANPLQIKNIPGRKNDTLDSIRFLDKKIKEFDSKIN